MTAPTDMLHSPEAGFEAPEDFDAFNAYCREHGWTDGLPVVPPTRQRVERMLGFCDRSWDQPVAKLAPRYGDATPIRVAANAVMAGCQPEYFPLVLTALEAMADDAYNLYGMQTTTHPCAPFILVNGPVARELGINCGHGALGSGHHANATIGRAVRLCLVNIGGAVPALGDMATYGNPAKFSYCAAENEATSPWEPLHVELGFPRESSTVTVFALEPPHNVNDHFSVGAESLLKTAAEAMSIPDMNDLIHQLHPVLMFGPEHAATAASSGFSKADVKRRLFELARVPFSRLSDEHREVWRSRRERALGTFIDEGGETYLRVLGNPDSLVVIVIGGAGKHSAFMPSFGNTRPVTRVLRHADGRDVRSIRDLLQH